MARTITTEIDIAAPADIVWGILTDFERFAEWNELIRRIEGDTAPGSRLVVELRLGERKPMTFKPRVLVFEPDRELRWRGRVLIPGLFDGEHSFVIEPLGDDRVRFHHAERFSGVLVPLMFNGMKDDVVASFNQMNAALAERAERAAAEQRTA